MLRLVSVLLALPLLACDAQATTSSPDSASGEGKPAAAPADGEPASEAARPNTVTVKGGHPDPDPGDKPITTPGGEPAEHPEHDPGPAAPTDDVAAGPSCEDGTRKPGDRWKQDCNDCWCTENGQTACTRKACVNTKNPG